MTRRDCTIADFVDDGRADIQTGPFGTQLKASDYVPDGVPVINVRNIGYGRLRENQLEYVTDTTAERLSVHVLSENDIVFGRKGAVDRHLLVQNGQAGWMQGSDCIRLRFLTDNVNPRFASYAFLSPSHQRWMLTQSSNKATMASLNQDIIKRIPLRLPSRTVQVEVVRILSAYDDLIQNNDRRMALLEQAARLLYEEWFVRLEFPGREHTQIVDGVPAGWRRVLFPEVVYVSPATPLPDRDEHWWVEMADLAQGSMLINGAAMKPGRNGSKFMNGDTLLARITPCLENGKTGFVNFLSDGEVGRGSTEFIVLRSKDLTPEYVYCLARTYPFRENAIKSMIGASGRQRVQVTCFDKFMVLVPPTRLLALFTDHVRPMFDQVHMLQNCSERAKTARDLLLPRLMSGEVAV